MPFPSLIPSSRVWTPGAAPVDAAAAGTGSEARVNASDLVEGSQLRLTFIGIAEGDWLALDAFAGEVGIGWQPFSLPASIWGGVSNQAHYLPAGYGWMFAEPPDIDDLPCGGHGAAVVLTAVPLAAAVAQGAQLTLTASIRTTLPVRAPGAALVAQALVRGGGATPVPVRAPGAALTAVASIAGGGGSNGSDPTFANTMLLLHLDGANNSTTFTDESNNALTVTGGGNAKISTAQSKYGGASLYLDGSNSSLSIAATSVFAFGSADYTVEAFIRANVSNAVSAYNYIWELKKDSSNFAALRFADSGFGHRLQFVAGTGYSDVFGVTLTKNDFTNTWKHVAVVRHNGVVTIYVDGVAATRDTSGPEAGTTVTHSLTGSVSLTVGMSQSGLYLIETYADEIRIKSEAVYTGNFTPPTAPLPDY